MATELKTSTGNTFVVRIYYTEHGTWQGQIGNVKTGHMQSFQSCLEMIRIIDDHLSKIQRGENVSKEERYDAL